MFGPATLYHAFMKTFLEKRFYFTMAVLTAVVVLIGFVPNFSARMLRPSQPPPLSLWVHTAVFSAWLIIFLVQSGLIQARKVAVHRTLGAVSAVLGVVLPIAGIWVAIDTSHERLVHGNNKALSFLLVPFWNMFFFAVVFALAIWWRKRPDFHRRLMLLASVSLTVAAFARFPGYIVPSGHFNIACDLLLLLAVGRDLIVEGRIHRVYLFGLPLLALGQAATEWLRTTPWWTNIALGILS